MTREQRVLLKKTLTTLGYGSFTWVGVVFGFSIHDIDGIFLNRALWFWVPALVVGAVMLWARAFVEAGESESE